MTPLDKLLQAGTILSNLAFNIKQRDKLDGDRWQQQFGHAQETWDKAMTAWQQSKKEAKQKRAKKQKELKKIEDRIRVRKLLESE